MHIIESELTPTRALLHRQHVERRTRMFVRRVRRDPATVPSRSIKPSEPPKQRMRDWLLCATDDGCVKITRYKFWRVIVGVASAYYKTETKHVYSPSRLNEHVQPRHLAIYLIREHTNLSNAEICRRLGWRDHSTGIYAYRKIIKRMQSDTKFCFDVAFIHLEIDRALSLWRARMQT